MHDVNILDKLILEPGAFYGRLGALVG
jgi:hypothetical protein